MGAKDGNFVAMMRCFFCHEGSGILLHKRFGDISEMDNKVVNMCPCTKCEDMMKQGIMIISVRDGQYDKMEDERREHERWRDRQLTDREIGYGRKYRSEDDVPGFIPNPYRTGVMLVLRDEAFNRIFCDGGNAGLIAKIIKCRWSFMEDSVLELTGLYDHVDKPDEVPYRVECRKKGLDPREEAIRLSNLGRKGDAKAKVEVESSPQEDGGIQTDPEQEGSAGV